MKTNNIVCIEGVDTRSLVAHVRIKGAMNCIISTEIKDIDQLKAALAETPSMDGLELASVVSTDKEYELGDPEFPDTDCSDGLWHQETYSRMHG